MRIAWVTDPHLDHCGFDRQNAFFKDLQEAAPDIVLLGGDFCQGNEIDHYLQLLDEKITVPVYFVLGNHDFYFYTIEGSRKKASQKFKNLTYLSQGGIIPIDNDTALVGHDGWYDARNGNTKSRFELTDFSAIRDLKHMFPKKFLFDKLMRLGDEAARFFTNILPKVFSQYKNVIVLTHVPPFEEICLYHGKPSEPDALPFFSCQVVGKILRDTMVKNTDNKMLVLAGHTHDEASAQILPNLSARAARACYGHPRFEIIDPVVNFL